MLRKLIDRVVRVRTYYGVDGESWTPYLSSVVIGRLRLHLFHRGDNDPDPHDHEWPFWTFPLVSYVEEVLTLGPKDGQHWLHRRVVRRFRWHQRGAHFKHRVLGRWSGSGLDIRHGRVITVVWRGNAEREWGFWRKCPNGYQFMHYKRYIFEGGKHAPCED